MRTTSRVAWVGSGGSVDFVACDDVMNKPNLSAFFFNTKPVCFSCLCVDRPEMIRSFWKYQENVARLAQCHGASRETLTRFCVLVSMYRTHVQYSHTSQPSGRNFPQNSHLVHICKLGVILDTLTTYSRIKPCYGVCKF